MAAACLPFGPGLVLSGVARHQPNLGLMTLGGGAVVAALLVLLLYWNAHRKVGRFEFVYKYGQPEPVRFIGFSDDHQVHQNQQSRQIVHLVRSSGPVTFKTFDPTLIAAFSVPRQVIYTHPKYPGIFVPAELFELGRPSQLASQEQEPLAAV